jgi:hypothetical protein
MTKTRYLFNGNEIRFDGSMNLPKIENKEFWIRGYVSKIETNAFREIEYSIFNVKGLKTVEALNNGKGLRWYLKDVESKLLERADEGNKVEVKGIIEKVEMV